MPALTREPLVHFMLLGAAIFGFQAWRQRGGAEQAPAEPLSITVDAATITRLKEGWTRQFQRTPDADDLRGLVEAHIREEVLCREALKLGLEREDTIIRRRLAQKMEFLTQDIATAGAPSEAALAEYFAKHQAKYAMPARLSFRHVYFSREKRGEAAETAAREALARLSSTGAAEEELGDGFLAGFEFQDQEEQEIAAAFGAEFAAAVGRMEPGAWGGPLISGYGAHLVMVTSREAPTPVEFAAAREAVRRDLTEERRRAANDEVLSRMKTDYIIAVDEAALSAAAADAEATSRNTP